MTDKAKRATIRIGNFEFEGFQMPDGGYRMSQANAADAIEDPPVYALRFIRSKDSKSLLGERYADYTPEQVEVEPLPNDRGQTRINALPLEVVSGYWLYRSHRGNKKAFVLSFALMAETLERRFDNAFGVTRSEDEYNQRLSDRVAQLESDIERLGEEFAAPDILREHISRLEDQVRQLGGDPLQIPFQQDEG